jgi:hypothetical protein
MERSVVRSGVCSGRASAVGESRPSMAFVVRPVEDDVMAIVLPRPNESGLPISATSIATEEPNGNEGYNSSFGLHPVPKTPS